MSGPVVQAGSIRQVSITGSVPSEKPLVPRQLPLAVGDFVGRTEQLAMLDALLPAAEGASEGAGGVVISTVSGAAGVGKTALAVRWAYKVQHLFPDGTLYANLRGYGPGEPASPGEVLAGFLTALGVPPERTPAEAQARAGVFRSVLAGRRVLVVLDNAGAPEQVRPLLPGAAGFVVVTSRSNLTGLAIGEGATRMTLDVLTEQEALALVRAILRPQRADAEPDSLSELVRNCARLPLALRIAAGRVAAHPYLTVADVVAELGSARGRLDALSVPADERNSMRAVFDWTYQRLSGKQARMFRRLGLHPGPEFGLHAAAAVAGAEITEARRLLDALADQYLIEPVARDRYRLHDLLRTYATERVDQDDAAERDHARRTLLEWYAHHALVAKRMLAPTLADRYAGSDLETPVQPELVFTDPAQAWSWANREYLNAVAVIRTAVREDVLQVAVRVADLSVVPLSQRRLWDELFEVCHLGLAAARRLGDQRGEYHLLHGLAYAYRDVRQWRECGDTLAAALAVARRIGDRWMEAQSRYYLGVLRVDQGRHAEAERQLRAALPLSVGAQRGHLEGDVELYLGVACIGLGHYEQALRHAERSLELQKESGNPHGEAHVMHCLARAHQGLGAHHEAITRCEQALRSETPLIDPREHAATLDTLGISLRHTGEIARAIAFWREALTIFEEFHDPRARDLRDRIHAVESPEAGIV